MDLIIKLIKIRFQSKSDLPTIAGMSRVRMFIVTAVAMLGATLPETGEATPLGQPSAPQRHGEHAEHREADEDAMMRTAIINQSFRGYKVLRAVPDTGERLKVLQGLVDDPALDFWTLPANVLIPVDIMSPPENLDALEGTLKDNVSVYHLYILV